MDAVLKTIKSVGLVLLRAIQTVATLGLFWRFHWITTQIRAQGGKHAGVLGLIYVHSDGDRLVVSRMLRKTRISLRQIAAVDRFWFPVLGVQIDTTGSRTPKVPTWTPHALAEYVEQAAMPPDGGSQGIARAA